MLKFIESNWGLAPLAARDRRANNFASAFDFTKPPREPSFVPATRSAAKPKEAVRAVVYIAYALAVALAAFAIAAAVASERRRRPTTAPPEPEVHEEVGV
jgi:phospholipase C